jgi:integrase
MNIQSSDVQSWISERLKDHAPNSVRLELTLLSVVFKKARTSLKIDHLENPCQDVERPSVADSARQRVLSPSEKWRIYREALRMSRRQRTHTGQIGAIVRLCLESPLRRQEVTRLCWEQFREIDYNDAMLGKVRVGVIYLKDTKTKTPRAVPLSRQMSNWIKKNRPSADAVGQIFTMPKEWITVAVRTIAARAGVADVTHHDFKRHSTSRYAEVGMPREMIRAASGTKTDRVLDQHYIVFQGAAVAARILREQELAKRARTLRAG